MAVSPPCSPSTLLLKGMQDDPGEVEDVEREQAAVEAGHLAEEAMVDDPEAPDHGEAERVGEQVLALVPERLGRRFRPAQMLGDVERQHQQRDRDREDAVAEGDDPRELDLVPLPPLRVPLPGHAGIIAAGRDGTADRSLLEWAAQAGVAQLVEHFIRNEGVPGSSPGVGSQVPISDVEARLP